MIVRIGDEIDGVSIDTSAGGRLASWVMAGCERLLVEPAAGIAPSLGWGCYLMAPFVGRVHQGWVDWAGLSPALLQPAATVATSAAQEGARHWTVWSG